MNYHTLIYQHATNNIIKSSLSAEYAQCIEDEEGRQKIKVKIGNSAATETASTVGVKRPAESDDIPHPVSCKLQIFIHSFITEIHIAPLQGHYSEALPPIFCAVYSNDCPY